MSNVLPQGIYASLPAFAFDGLNTPIKDISVKIALRTKMHEFPHADGGALEKLGRKPVEVTGKIPFHGTFSQWRGLFSETLPAMRELAKSQKTGRLVIPHFGQFDASIVSWTETTRGLSGVDVDVSWVEDLSDNFRVAALTERWVRNVSDSGKTFINYLTDFEGSLTIQDQALDLGGGRKVGSIFSDMRSLVTTIDSISDQVDLYSSLLTSKLTELEGLCGLLDRLFPPYNDPNHVRDLEILHELWNDTITAAQNINARLPEVDTYVLPRTMSASEAAREIYADAARGADVLGLNVQIEDPFRIPLGTQIRYFRFDTAA